MGHSGSSLAALRTRAMPGGRCNTRHESSRLQTLIHSSHRQQAIGSMPISHPVGRIYPQNQTQTLAVRGLESTKIRHLNRTAGRRPVGAAAPAAHLCAHLQGKVSSSRRYAGRSTRAQRRRPHRPLIASSEPIRAGTSRHVPAGREEGTGWSRSPTRRSRRAGQSGRDLLGRPRRGAGEDVGIVERRALTRAPHPLKIVIGRRPITAKRLPTPRVPRPGRMALRAAGRSRPSHLEVYDSAVAYDPDRLPINHLHTPPAAQRRAREGRAAPLLK